MTLTQSTRETGDESEQATLTDTDALHEARVHAQRQQALDVDQSPYAASETDEVVRRPNSGLDTTCQHCQTTVSTHFVRVFGAEDGTVHCCSDCATFRELQNGCAATEGYTPDDEEVTGR